MLAHYLAVWWELITRPFQEISLVWGIVPLYFGWFLNEIASPKANFRTAVQTGFSFLWAAAQWLYPYFHHVDREKAQVNFSSIPATNLAVIIVVVVFGALALYSGLRRKYPPYCRFLGYTRFANYFMITIFAMQAHKLLWSWDRLWAIFIFAIPIWLLLHFGLAPLRK